MHKIVLIILLSLISLNYSYAQGNPRNPPGNSIKSLVTTLDHDTCLNKQFSIVFYIVLDSNYNVRTATPLALKEIIDTLNSTFKPICVSFVNCSTVFIPNYPYNRWKRSTTDPQVTANWYTEKTINLYIVDSILPEGQYEDTKGSYAYPPPLVAGGPAKDVIVMEQFRSVPHMYFFMLHAFGHFFGLSHTYAELNPLPAAIPGPPTNVVSQEYADGSNNTIHGDLLADTEADPGPVAAFKDGKNENYIRPLDNFMSFLDPFGCRFTQQQYNLMARTILTRRLYLH